MPFYDYRCESEDCGHEFTKRLSMSQHKEPQVCPECESPAKKLITGCGVIFKGDDWASKNSRVSKQMAENRRRAGLKQEERVKDGALPGGKLVPNVGGERVESWGEAAKLAKDKGKDTSGYEKMAAKEKTLTKKLGSGTTSGS
jgi:putative FmdB family regulatory protein